MKVVGARTPFKYISLNLEKIEYFFHDTSSLVSRSIRNIYFLYAAFVYSYTFQCFNH